MDIIDQAQKFEELNLAQSLHAQRAIARNTLSPSPAGHCLNIDCGEPFELNSPRLFCGPACAQRFDQTSKVNR